MIRLQNWRPDTCSNPSCEFTEQWDDAVDPVSRTHTFVSRNIVCARHASISDPAACFIANYDENRRKNTCWQICLSAKATLLIGQFQWSFNSNGVLLVNLSTFATTSQKTQIQNACDVQFGSGKVVIS